MKTKIAILALAALSFASCNKNDEIPQNSNFPTDGVIRVATSVEGLKTRAGTTTDNIEELGLCVTNSSSPTYNYNNVQMTKSNGIWLSASMMLWQNSTQAVDIVAYTPYQGAVAYTTTTTDAIANVEADQSATDESGIIASDFLGVRKTGFVPKNDLNANGKIDLELPHLMSKINLSITLGTEFNIAQGTATNPITDIKVNGTKLKGLCNFTTMAVTTAAADNDAASVIPFTGTYTAGEAEAKNAVAKYESIFVPQTVAANGFTVSFTIDGKPYEWKSTAAVTLVGGNQHNLKLTVGKDFVSVDSFGSSEWGTGTGSDLETE